jgi:hypothetical protein
MEMECEMSGTFTQKEIDRFGERFWLEGTSLSYKIKWYLFEKRRLKRRNVRGKAK